MKIRNPEIGGEVKLEDGTTVERLCYDLLPILLHKIIPIKNGEITIRPGMEGSWTTIYTTYDLANIIEHSYENENLLFKILHEGEKQPSREEKESDASEISLIGLHKKLQEILNEGKISRKMYSRIKETIEELIRRIWEKEKEEYKYKTIFNIRRETR